MWNLLLSRLHSNLLFCFVFKFVVVKHTCFICSFFLLSSLLHHAFAQNIEDWFSPFLTFSHFTHRCMSDTLRTYICRWHIYSYECLCSAFQRLHSRCIDIGDTCDCFYHYNIRMHHDAIRQVAYSKQLISIFLKKKTIERQIWFWRANIYEYK